MDQPSTRYATESEDAACSSDQDRAGQDHSLELSLLAGASSMQFNRCHSLDAMRCSPGRLGISNSSWACLDEESSDSTVSPTWRAPSFEPFEVEEQATEVKFLRGQLSKKEEECEHLRQIIKELSHSRHLVAKTKVEMEEQYVALQKEYLRVVKVCDLARSVSGEATSRINRLKAELRTSQDDLARTKRHYRSLADQQAVLRSENEALRRRLALMEQSRFAEDCHSACAREYMLARVTLY